MSKFISEFFLKLPLDNNARINLMTTVFQRFYVTSQTFAAYGVVLTPSDCPNAVVAEFNEVCDSQSCTLVIVDVYIILRLIRKPPNGNAWEIMLHQPSVEDFAFWRWKQQCTVDLMRLRQILE